MPTIQQLVREGRKRKKKKKSKSRSEEIYLEEGADFPREEVDEPVVSL